MSELEGVKPHLTLVTEPAATTPATTGNIIDAEFANYGERMAWIITRLTESKLRGVAIDKPAVKGGDKIGHGTASAVLAGAE